MTFEELDASYNAIEVARQELRDFRRNQKGSDRPYIKKLHQALANHYRLMSEWYEWSASK